MLVAAIQHDVVWEDQPATCAHLEPLIAEAADRGAGLAVLTEMYSTGFSIAADRIAEDPDGPSVRFLHECAERHGMWGGGSVPVADRPDALPVNRFVVAGPDGTRHHYDKRYPFSYAREDEHYRAGDQRVTVELDGVRVTLTTCYDLRFSDVYWEPAPDTDCYLVVANWPDTRRNHWRTLLRARAIENQAYVVGVNRMGADPKLAYTGDSAVIDPAGETLAEAEPGVEAVLVAEVDPGRVAEVRAAFPFMADRR